MDFLSKNNFIESFQIEGEVCDNLIKYFNRDDTYKVEGRTTNGIEKQVKNSIDCGIPLDKVRDIPEVDLYVKKLLKCMNLYHQKYEFCHFSPYGIAEVINIQYYPVSGGYYEWHCERSNNCPIVQDRHLVFMTYLNDVYSGGETEFYHQKKKIKARRGKTLIWPSDWTHTHRGLPSHKEEKYIITGWFSYIDTDGME